MLAFRDDSKFKATERKSLILRVPDIPPKIWRKKKSRRHKQKCLEASTQLKDATCAAKTNSFDITPPRNNRRGPPCALPRPGKSKTDKPQQRYHELDRAELLECHQAYQTWTKGWKIKADSPIPGLKKKYPACRHKSFFTRLTTRSFEHGKISPMKSPGRPQTYDEDYDHIIKEVVDAKRALQQCNSAKQSQDAIKAARLKPVPCEKTIRLRKIELGIIKFDVKFKPQ